MASITPWYFPACPQYDPAFPKRFPARPSRAYLYRVKFLRKIQPVLVAAAVVLTACTASPDKPIAEQGPASPVAAAEMALMARHDSLMAQTDQLYSLKAQVSAAHSPTSAPYVHGLLAADAAMMDWMHKYHKPDSTTAPAARLAYFRQQQEVLANVHRQYRATMDSAALFIGQHPTPAAPASSK